MKRFLLFSGINYYPSGGWDDFVVSADTIEVLTNLNSNDDWAHIVDSTTMKVVLARNNGRPWAERK